MTQISPDTWCERLQGKLMAGLEAAWALIERADDPALIKKVREKARLIGQMAATARQIVLMVPPRRPVSVLAAGAASIPVPEASEPRPERGIDRLKGGRRGRL
ncbi:MAG: hypothetical protein KKC14_11065 [Alphaproteobacteria bacterium]|nr:hypothetical protein [Alphaproteobacteria bacterium]